MSIGLDLEQKLASNIDDSSIQLNNNITHIFPIALCCSYGAFGEFLLRIDERWN